MLTASPILAGADALDEARTYLRIDGDAEDAVLGALLAAAIARCEDFIGERLMRRGFVETVTPYSGAWRMLRASPVASIGQVRAIDDAGTTTDLSPSAYEIDLLASGQGRIRFLTVIHAGRVAVAYEAGRVTDWSAIEGQLRAGIVRLAAHWRVHREDDADVPGAVLAHWRAARRVRL